MKFRFSATIAAAVISTSFAAQANDFAPQIEKFYADNIQTAITEQVLVGAIKSQNTETSGLTPEAIDTLDQQWRAEAKAGGGAMIERVLSSELSGFLKQLKDAHPGLITEIFVMDGRGLNVGQSDVTSDYNQGDEGKWQKTYAVGPNAMFIDDVEFDDSSGSFQSQVSGAIVDPATGKAIGAITVGLNVEELQ